MTTPTPAGSIVLSIIIPTYNTQLITRRCIENIYAFPPSQPFEIVVVDNHSSDDTVGDVEYHFPNVRLIVNTENLGFSRACNRGARESSGRYLLFLNSDTEARERTFDRLIEWLDDHKKTAIVGPQLMGPNDQLQQMSWVWNPVLFWELLQQYFAPYAVRRSKLRQWMIKSLQRRSISVPSICGACLMIRREAFDAIGGFDEDFELYFEDSDLCFRCREAGWTIDFVADARILHHLGKSTRGSWNNTSLIYQQSHIHYYKKHTVPFVVWLLKMYLLFKWLRLQWVLINLSEDVAEARAYCRVYRQLIFEKKHLTLARGFMND